MQQTKSAIRPLRSGELARLAGVSADTLRHYERQGLLPRAQRTAAGYRQYAPATLARVQLIRGALAIGFSLAELRQILAARDSGAAPCKSVRDLAAAKARDLGRRVREMRQLQRELAATIRAWDRKLGRTPHGERAGLLEDFVTAHPESTRKISPLVSPGLKRKLQNRGDQ